VQRCLDDDDKANKVIVEIFPCDFKRYQQLVCAHLASTQMTVKGVKEQTLTLRALRLFYQLLTATVTIATIVANTLQCAHGAVKAI